MEEKSNTLCVAFSRASNTRMVLRNVGIWKGQQGKSAPKAESRMPRGSESGRCRTLVRPRSAERAAGLRRPRFGDSVDSAASWTRVFPAGASAISHRAFQSKGQNRSPGTRGNAKTKSRNAAALIQAPPKSGKEIGNPPPQNRPRARSRLGYPTDPKPAGNMAQQRHPVHH